MTRQVPGQGLGPQLGSGVFEILYVWRLESISYQCRVAGSISMPGCTGIADSRRTYDQKISLGALAAKSHKVSDTTFICCPMFCLGVEYSPCNIQRNPHSFCLTRSAIIEFCNRTLSSLNKDR